MTTPQARQALNTLAANTPSEAVPGVRDLADAIRADLPDLDDATIGRVMLTAFGVLAFVASLNGDMPGPAGKYLAVGGAVAAALAAPERASSSAGDDDA